LLARATLRDASSRPLAEMRGGFLGGLEALDLAGVPLPAEPAPEACRLLVAQSGRQLELLRLERHDRRDVSRAPHEHDLLTTGRRVHELVEVGLGVLDGNDPHFQKDTLEGISVKRLSLESFLPFLVPDPWCRCILAVDPPTTTGVDRPEQHSCFSFGAEAAKRALERDEW
jgi:hypothetical protein